jgi:formylglycine-generating enzyme required for sulfatase activity
MKLNLSALIVLLAAFVRADFVTIGGTDVGADPATGYGAVSYTYQISRYEVTGAEFGAAVAADSRIGNSNPTTGNKPAEYVSWYEAVKYCNWLTSGDAYLGAYTHDGSGTFTGIDRASAISTYGIVYVLPTENEWYKAAYWRDDVNDQWSLYANGTDTKPTWGTTAGWNYRDGTYGYAYGGITWDVGHGAQEQNGTYDMMGNVWEWTEAMYDASRRLLRGGGNGSNAGELRSSVFWGGGGFQRKWQHWFSYRHDSGAGHGSAVFSWWCRSFSASPKPSIYKIIHRTLI